MALKPRGKLLHGTLACLMVDVEAPELQILHCWLDNWNGIGLIERGMARENFDLSLTRYADEGWRATFYVKGREHSATFTTGDGWQRTPWAAVQRAAWEALNKADNESRLTAPTAWRSRSASGHSPSIPAPRSPASEGMSPRARQ
jgi:hypothetical protein